MSPEIFLRISLATAVDSTLSVGSRVGYQLFLVEFLNHRQGLVGTDLKKPGTVVLQLRQVVEQGRILLLLLPLRLCDGSSFSQAIRSSIFSFWGSFVPEEASFAPAFWGTLSKTAVSFGSSRSSSIRCTASIFFLEAVFLVEKGRIFIPGTVDALPLHGHGSSRDCGVSHHPVKGVLTKSRISRSRRTTIPSTQVMTRPTEITLYFH